MSFIPALRRQSKFQDCEGYTEKLKRKRKEKKKETLKTRTASAREETVKEYRVT